MMAPSGRVASSPLVSSLPELRKYSAAFYLSGFQTGWLRSTHFDRDTAEDLIRTRIMSGKKHGIYYDINVSLSCHIKPP